MHTGTGEILPLEKVMELPKKQRIFYKEIPEELNSMLDEMNRAQRREWYRKNKDRFKNVR